MTNELQNIEALNEKYKELSNAIIYDRPPQKVFVEYRRVRALLEKAKADFRKNSTSPMQRYGCNPFGSTGHMHNHPGE